MATVCHRMSQIHVHKGSDNQNGVAMKQWIDLRAILQETPLFDGKKNHLVKRWEGLKVKTY